jgi:uncharacterized protein (UPF0276 family)
MSPGGGARPADPATPLDRVGLGWRGELAAGIFEHLGAIDVLEVIAEDWWHAPRREARALGELARLRPVMLHAVTLGLASAGPVPDWRVQRLARLVDRVRPESWSEHLAFVRAGDIEIGHLAAPPRTPATAEGALANVERVARTVGARPALENIATLVEPPASTMAEPQWVGDILDACGCGLLLDLHNLMANALNFGPEPAAPVEPGDTGPVQPAPPPRALALLQAMPLSRVVTVHVAGGRWITPPGGGRPRLLDDHLHDVPPEIFALLEVLAQAVPQPLTVILERDGRYPAFSVLRSQMDEARAALARGRAMRAERAAQAGREGPAAAGGRSRLLPTATA